MCNGSFFIHGYIANDYKKVLLFCSQQLSVDIRVPRTECYQANKVNNLLNKNLANMLQNQY